MFFFSAQQLYNADGYLDCYGPESCTLLFSGDGWRKTGGRSLGFRNEFPTWSWTARRGCRSSTWCVPQGTCSPIRASAWTSCTTSPEPSSRLWTAACRSSEPMYYRGRLTAVIQLGTWPIFVEIAISTSSKNDEDKSKAAPRYNQLIARKWSSKLDVTS